MIHIKTQIGNVTLLCLECAECRRRKKTCTSKHPPEVFRFLENDLPDPLKSQSVLLLRVVRLFACDFSVWCFLLRKISVVCSKTPTKSHGALLSWCLKVASPEKHLVKINYHDSQVASWSDPRAQRCDDKKYVPTTLVVLVLQNGYGSSNLGVRRFGNQCFFWTIMNYWR